MDDTKLYVDGWGQPLPPYPADFGVPPGTGCRVLPIQPACPPPQNVSENATCCN